MYELHRCSTVKCDFNSEGLDFKKYFNREVDGKILFEFKFKDYDYNVTEFPTYPAFL
jgi:hypothetical protein